MCGIVGAVATTDVVGMLVQGLQRLEYRGYDSCGLAVHRAAPLADAAPTIAAAGARGLVRTRST
ncbi:MAG: hypothetical protein ACUVVU_06100, partial [Tepidimonas sp.]|uniref:hypothetical protein n=1 Tax=Tepidimonas sp. TaxID=2002775 RepID=UPI004054D818